MVIRAKEKNEAEKVENTERAMKEAFTEKATAL